MTALNLAVEEDWKKKNVGQHKVTNCAHYTNAVYNKEYCINISKTQASVCFVSVSHLNELSLSVMLDNFTSIRPSHTDLNIKSE